MVIKLLNTVNRVLTHEDFGKFCYVLPWGINAVSWAA